MPQALFDFFAGLLMAILIGIVDPSVLPTVTPAAPVEVVTPAPEATPEPPILEDQPLPGTPAATPDPVLCDPSYPTLCLDIANGDTLNCADITARRFPVIGADPYNLDANHNGIGCESR